MIEGHDCVAELKASLEMTSWSGLIGKYYSAQLSDAFLMLLRTEDITIPLLEKCEKP